MEKYQIMNNMLVKDNTLEIRKKSIDVTLPLNKEDEDTMKKMMDWVLWSQDEEQNDGVKSKRAIGIAAPQIGVNKNMYYIKLNYFNESLNKNKKIEYAMINPKIIAFSKQEASLEHGEGCLSVDKNHEGFVIRKYCIEVKGYDYITKTNISKKFYGYEAIVFQHEQQHLEGILYYDNINKKNPWYKDSDLILI